MTDMSHVSYSPLHKRPVGQCTATLPRVLQSLGQKGRVDVASSRHDHSTCKTQNHAPTEYVQDVPGFVRSTTCWSGEYVKCVDHVYIILHARKTTPVTEQLLSVFAPQKRSY